MHKRLTYNFVKEAFLQENYTLISDEYMNAKTKLKYSCPEGHKHTIDWDHWQRGKRCPYCAGNAKLDFDIVRDNFECYNYTLLSKVYINVGTHLDYICNMGHKNSMTYNHFNDGKRCPTCYNLNQFGRGNPAYIDGRSNQGYCPIWKDKEYKNSIKERDNYTCQNPYCYKTTDKLVVHHINYEKKLCGPENLITVCIGCNGRANKDRFWHTYWYKTILNNKYDYRYK